jgi:single-stranded-DNA-specific exonuclease
VDIITEAKEKGIEFIICDHHKTGPDLPPAVAILNPKQDDCPYPYKHLSGCGIGFKLIQAYSIQYNLPFDPYDYLDYTAVSIASDIVPVTGENRIMAFHGLKVFNTNPKPGFKALMASSKITGEVNVNDLIFKIGPRINAAGRIASGTLAVKMLVENDLKKAEEYTTLINTKNVERQSMDKSIFIQARDMVINTRDFENQRSIVLFNPDWHRGVIGIVASRLIEEFHRPTVMLTESNGVAVGSSRSVPGYDLYNALDKCSDYLEQWGGHTSAAGLTMKVEKIKDFQLAFEEQVRKTMTTDLMTPVIEYDLEISLNEISTKFCQTLERFGPFGPENDKPIFVTRNIYNSYNIRLMNNAFL